MKDIPSAIRPREKILTLGPASLADAELVALLLRTGCKGTSVLQLAQQLLDTFGGLAGLLQTLPQDFASIKGLGPAKRAEIAAVMEMARRTLLEQLKQNSVFDSTQQVKDYLQMQLGHLRHEVFAVMFLDAQHRLLKFEEMFRGTLTQTSVYPREVVKRALQLEACAVVLAHNHPSGAVQPSSADEFLTHTLQSALQLIDVQVLDHLIVGQTEVMSFAQSGLL